ncbi:MAG: hypothetical protein H6621_11380 [Halobacteriovoraceae bacterium]|nr:hypothetical protein [Halobacteriovoraceae bacterium]MCB9095661.1 hypothetical protein [Halobacteriovoraceae bacterium]
MSIYLKLLKALIIVIACSTSFLAEADNDSCIETIITHPQQEWDTSKAIFNQSIDYINSHFGCKNKAHVLLNTKYSTYIPPKVLRKASVHRSESGEHDIWVKGDRVIVVGGLHSLCHFHTMEKVIENRLVKGFSQNLEILAPLNAIYGWPNGEGTKTLDRIIKEIRRQDVANFLLDGDRLLEYYSCLDVYLDETEIYSYDKSLYSCQFSVKISFRTNLTL